MYCWKCTGQGFLPTQAGSALLFSVVFSLFPIGKQSCRTGVCGRGGALLFYHLAVGVCACMCAYTGDVAGDDQRDE